MIVCFVFSFVSKHYKEDIISCGDTLRLPSEQRRGHWQHRGNASMMLGAQVLRSVHESRCMQRDHATVVEVLLCGQ